jgi:RHS repeat-associated protein
MIRIIVFLYSKNSNTENRTHNDTNKLQGIATHDANGNMVLMPGLKGKYDAWNRLVEVRDSNDNLIAQYEYNGLNQRIKKTVGSTVTKSFFNENWQEVESVTNNQVTSYVWGLRYIDDLVLRDKGEERLYSLADPNWNVIAICNASGNIQERYAYDAFGKQNIFDENFTAKTGTEFSWNRAFTGQVLDSETGVMLYRNRYYHVELGRFINRDPIEYVAGDMNIYRITFNKAILDVDPFGYTTVYPGGPIYDISDIASQLPPDSPYFTHNDPLPPVTQFETNVDADGFPSCPDGYTLVNNAENPPTANGCGPFNMNVTTKALLNWLQMVVGNGNLIFSDPCNTHDLCYGNCKNSKGKCDDNFYEGMLKECNKRYGGPQYIQSGYHRCSQMASIFYTAVSKGGASAHSNAVKKHCQCKCNAK